MIFMGETGVDGARIVHLFVHPSVMSPGHQAGLLRMGFGNSLEATCFCGHKEIQPADPLVLKTCKHSNFSLRGSRALQSYAA